MDIQAIHGIEPMREGEYPMSYMVGSFDRGLNATVTSILRETENFGDHGLLWFHIYAGNDKISSIQGRAVAQVIYSTSARSAAERP